MKLIDVFADSMDLIADAYTRPREYAHPSKNGFRQDQMRLAGDVKKVGNDMRRVIAKRDEQTHQSSSKRR